MDPLALLSFHSTPFVSLMANGRQVNDEANLATRVPSSGSETGRLCARGLR